MTHRRELLYLLAAFLLGLGLGDGCRGERERRDAEVRALILKGQRK